MQLGMCCTSQAWQQAPALATKLSQVSMHRVQHLEASGSAQPALAATRPFMRLR
jgi:hypothetical protein